jgi:hypothetical protein
MVGYHLTKGVDLVIQGGDDLDLGGDDRCERGLHRCRLSQLTGPKDGHDLFGDDLRVAPVRPGQRGQDLTFGEPRRLVRIRRQPQQLQGVGRIQLVVGLQAAGKDPRKAEPTRTGRPVRDMSRWT